MKKLFFLIIAIIILGVISFFWNYQETEEGVIVIKNFEECIIAGYPVLESYPRQCKTEIGESFIEDIGDVLDKTDLIRVGNLQPNDLIESPLFIKGEARGYWFFEADFPIVLLDEAGNTLGIAIATALSDWMVDDFVSFEATLEFQIPNNKNGYLILKKNNPSGLSEYDDQLRIPVRFK